MKATNILLVFALLFLARASEVTFEFTSFAEVGQVATTKYGKSLVETISLTLKNGGDINSVEKLLDSLLFKLNKDQERADEDWRKESTRLKEKIARLAKEIKILNEEIRKLKVEKEKYEKLIIRVLANLKQYKNQLADDRKQVGVLKVTRAKDIADFKRSQSEHLDIINAINVVIKELQRLVGSISGKGRPVHVQEIAQEKRDALYAKNHPKTGALAEISKILKKSFLEISKEDQDTLQFVQMATEADQDSLNKLINLLKKLRNSTEKSFNDDKAAEERSKRAYARLLASLNADIKRLVAMIATSEKHLIEYNAKVKKLTIEIASKTKIRNNKIKEKKATEKEYEVKKHQYETEKKERAEDIAIVRKLQRIVKTRLANMSKYLKDATGA